MRHHCCKCGGYADFRFGRARAVEWNGRVWPKIPFQDYCRECHARDFPDEIEIHRAGESVWREHLRRKELN